jgi:hypothetical protein
MKDKENLNLGQNFKLSVEKYKKEVQKYKKEDFVNSTPHDLRVRDENLREKTLKNDITQQELDLKKGICAWVKWVVSVYLIFIAYILLLLVLNEGKLESSVVIALLTTTTINILGLPYMIIKSLFPEKKN